MANDIRKLPKSPNAINENANIEPKAVPSLLGKFSFSRLKPDILYELKFIFITL
jgi:hypothetical protein